MAYIGHRCACGHGDLDHGRHTQCEDAPELLPTFDRNGKPVERIIPPGNKLATEGNTGPRTCDCGACEALYAQTVGAGPRPVA